MSKEIEKTKSSLRKYRKYTLILSILGFGLSYYSLWVEVSKELDPNYKALCDFSENVSCSTVFTSKYGKGFGVLGYIFGDNSTINQPNGVYGMISYSLFALLSLTWMKPIAKFELIMAVIANFMSAYLGYILYYILNDFCVVCVTTYIINFFLLIVSVLKSRTIKKLNETQEAAEYTNFLDGRTGFTKKRV